MQTTQKRSLLRWIGCFKQVVPIFILFCCLALSVQGCTSQQPILVGFVGELTGRGASLSVGQRNGVMLAVEEINKKGGIQGRKIEIITMDDEGKPLVAQKVDTQLIQQGVIAIIGHSTSAQAAAVLDILNQAKVVMVSPTISSTQFSNLDDYLFRITPDTRQIGRTLGRYILQQDLHRLVTINEQRNSAFTQQIYVAIQEELQKDDRIEVQSLAYTEGETDLTQLVLSIIATDPDGVIFISPSVDTALLAQQLRLRGSTASFFATHWSQSVDLIPKGGRAVDGMIITAILNPNNTHPNYISFQQRFFERYQMQPDFVAVYGYEAMLVLAEAIRIADAQPQKLKDALTRIKDFPVVQGTISLTPQGDCVRETYIIEVRNGKFQWLQTIPPLP